jgi:hypothetical protein
MDEHPKDKVPHGVGICICRFVSGVRFRVINSAVEDTVGSAVGEAVGEAVGSASDSGGHPGLRGECHDRTRILHRTHVTLDVHRPEWIVGGRLPIIRTTPSIV